MKKALTSDTGVARMLKKRLHERETTVSSNMSLFKMGTSLKGKNLLPEVANSFL